MTTDDTANASRSALRTSEFEEQLTDLILTAFAEGADVAGHWRIETPTDSVPDRTIEITCHS